MNTPRSTRHLLAALSVAAFVLTERATCADARGQDPTPLELSAIAKAVPERPTVKPTKPRRMLILSYLMRFYLDGIQFALGDLPVDTTPSALLTPATPYRLIGERRV